MNKLVISLICLSLTSCNDFAARLNIYPKGEKASCLSQPKNSLKSQNPKLAKYVEDASKQSYSSPYSLWDQNTLKNNPKLRQALQEYTEGKRGLSVKNLKLSHKTPEAIHYELKSKGFSHKRTPLMVSPYDAVPSYWRIDGSTTRNKMSAGLVHMDTYYHSDGGVVRVKPQGVPSPKYPRAKPHATKSVLLDATHSNDTSWENEAFKVSDDGYPIPKAPTKAAGLKIDEAKIKQDLVNAGEDLVANWINSVMDKAHLDVKVDFSHCH